MGVIAHAGLCTQTCLLALLAMLAVCQGYIATPLVGYQQGIVLQVSPPEVAGGQCLVYGVPTPSGYAERAQTPLFVYTPQNTGTHVLQFVYDRSKYVLSPFLAPGQTTLQVDPSDQGNPLISFDAAKSPQGQSGAVTIYLSDRTNAAIACSSQIQFTVDPPLTCLPTFGGIYPQQGNNSPAPPNAGNFVIPSGTVYSPTYVQQNIVQQFTTVNNININNVVVNVNQITNTQIINNIIVEVPPTPPPVNCTQDPTNPVCVSQPPNNPTPQPTTGPVPVPPGGPTPQPTTGPVPVPPTLPPQTPNVSTLPLFPPPPAVSTLPLVPPSPSFSILPVVPPTSQNAQPPVQGSFQGATPPPPQGARPPTVFTQTGRRMKV